MKIKDMILVAMFAVLTSVGAYISIPIPTVPITLQFMFCVLSGAILGSKRGALSQIIYVLLGLIGLPVFAGGTGGINHVFSPTFGYLIGFILCAFIVGKFAENMKQYSAVKIFLGGLVGLFVVYTIGVAYLYLILNFVVKSPVDVIGALKIGFLPFVLKDVLVTALSAAVAKAIVPRLHEAGLLERKAKYEA